MRDNTRFFSVIIPLHNKEPHIAKAIESVLNQTYQQFELIVINDASTDGSREVAKRFADSYEIVSLYDRTHPGPGGYAARNLGVGYAKHKYVAFLDADDFWDKEFLNEMNDAISLYPSAKVYSCGWKNLFKDGLSLVDNHTKRYKNKGIHKISFDEYLKRSSVNLGPICSISAVIRKETLVDVGGFPVNQCRYGGDIDTWFRLIRSADSIVVVPIPLATYYRDAINMVTDDIGLEIKETCLRKTVEKVLGESTRKYRIKKYSNFHQLIVVKRRVLSCELEYKDLRFLYISVQPFIYTMLLIFSIIPNNIKRLIVNNYFKLKKLIS